MSNTNSPQRPSVKIAYIGGGSRYWARDLMKDLALQACFDGEISLYDIDFPAAQKNVEIGNLLFRRKEAVSHFKVRAVKTLKTCLKNADFVVISIEPGPIENRFADLEIPLKFGVLQPVGDSTGPGGWLRGLRSIPVFEDFAHQIMQHCPDAWVINYTNPMTLCTRALYAAEPKIKAFGCCHEVFGTQWRLLRMAHEKFGFDKIDRKEIKVDVNGINHFTWVTKASCRGENLMPMVKEFTQDPDYFRDRSRQARKRVKEEKLFGSEGLVAMDLMRRFGALAAAGDRHLVEFVPWYARSLKELYRWGVVPTPYAWRLKNREGSGPDVDHYRQSDMNPTGEEGVQQMEALLGLGDLDTNVNLPNLGQSADILFDAVVETNAAFRKDQVVPLTAVPLPDAAQVLVDRVVSIQEMILEAAMNRDIDASIQALLCDPLMGIPTDKGSQMAEEMLCCIGPELEGMGYRLPAGSNT